MLRQHAVTQIFSLLESILAASTECIDLTVLPPAQQSNAQLQAAWDRFPTDKTADPRLDPVLLSVHSDSGTLLPRACNSCTWGNYDQSYRQEAGRVDWSGMHNVWPKAGPPTATTSRVHVRGLSSSNPTSLKPGAARRGEDQLLSCCWVEAG